MEFWIIAAALAAVCATLVAAEFRRATPAADREPRDIGVYRAQLAAVTRDVARGTVAADEAERMRTEIKRRILEADRSRGLVAGAAPGRATLVVTILCTVGVIGGSLALYWQIGAPGYPDLPLRVRIAQAADLAASRPSQAAAEAQLPPRPSAEVSEPFAELLDKLRVAVATRPNDLEGQRLLARNEAALGNFVAGSQAQARVIALLGATATARDHADHADLLILAAGGYVSPEAEAALATALALDPLNGTARYYLGLMHLQTGRPDLGFRLWEALLRDSAPSDPWVAPLRAQIEEAAFRAGVEYSLPPETDGPRGPSQADIAAAAQMSAADRMAMIENMVEGLNTRLADEGGPPQDWARLIRALGVLGRTAEAGSIWTEAQTRFEGAALDPVLQAARDAGVAD